jgi:hypothetical protein
MPAASAMPASGTPLAEKKDRRESSKSSGDTDRPPLRAVRIAATRGKRRGGNRRLGEKGEKRGK